jgi:N-(2-amino-2-carboxyethyl)-L-glutamate synthase
VETVGDRTVLKVGPAGAAGRAIPVGDTPMRAVDLVIGGAARGVHLKLEGHNPGGSIKDRTALSLIESLERRGTLRPGATVIDSTSGNLGVALAMIARARGYEFVAVVDPKTTEENLAKMTGMGAHLERVSQPDETGGYLLSRLARVRELCASSDRFVWTDQYSNPANPHAHFRSTGPEIYRAMDGQVDAVFVAVSTGGTLAGVGRYFRTVSPRTRVVGVDARGSVVFGGPPAPRLLTGIGSSRRSSFLTPDLVDEHRLVGDASAFAFCRALDAATGIKVGGSSGAVLAGCAGYLAEHPEVQRVACICADRGENYLTSIFDDDWLSARGLAVGAADLGPVTDIALAPTARQHAVIASRPSAQRQSA